MAASFLMTLKTCGTTALRKVLKALWTPKALACMAPTMAPLMALTKAAHIVVRPASAELTTAVVDLKGDTK